MQPIDECYKKVKNDCFKFINLQEAKTNKFKNKNKMLKSYLIPLSFWIAKKSNKKSPLIIGLSGGQGTGKTTISSIISLILRKYFKLDVFKISIDDFYKTRKDRKKLSITNHSLLMTRGVPGTHDYRIIYEFFKKIKNKKFSKLSLPKFDKSKDDRCHKKLWYKINSRPNVVIFEGWCVGAKAQNNSELTRSINYLEKTKDPDLAWRKYVNIQLKIDYKNLFKQLNEIIYLRANNFRVLQKWRIQQEKKLQLKSKNKKNLRIMNRNDIINFMQTYQRITQNMFKDAPKYASVVMKLNSNHQINSIKFR
jgi:D-glycerate 3-kinase